MSDLNGVDLDALTESDIGGGVTLPPIQSDLVHLCDADLGAYEVVDLDKTDVENYADFLDWIEYRRLLCGSYRTIPFITLGDKGGRYELAVVAEYQGKRAKNRDPDVTNRVHALRQLLAERDTRCVVADHDEADDQICQYQLSALRGTPIGSLKSSDRTITDSADKDLRMFAGLHLDPKSYEAVDVTGFGSCYLDESTSAKKCLGWGTSFFWHQLLMGDSADNIPGLPRLSGELANVYSPTAPITKAKSRLELGGTDKQLDSARKTLANRNPIKIGPVMALTILDGCVNDYEAMLRVRDAYLSWYGPGSFDVSHWNGSTVRKTAGHMLLEQARLLWMRRVPRECPSVFFAEVVEQYKLEEMPW